MHLLFERAKMRARELRFTCKAIKESSNCTCSLKENSREERLNYDKFCYLSFVFKICCLRFVFREIREMKRDVIYLNVVEK